jgi:hypothetical protein
MQHVLPNNFVRVRYYGLMHPAFSEEIKKIRNLEGNVTVSDRHALKNTNVAFRECSTCKKPFLMTMVIFPSYLAHRINYQDKYPSKFYNKDECRLENHLKMVRTTSRSS